MVARASYEDLVDASIAEDAVRQALGAAGVAGGVREDGS
jgi:hypothetical protein